jgi:hypothetical protein
MIEKLVESILMGFPLGSILIWNSDNAGSYVLDGQQRTISILKIRNKPLKFLSKKSIEMLVGKNKNNVEKFILKNKELTNYELVDENNNFNEKIKVQIANTKINLNDSKIILEYIKS